MTLGRTACEVAEDTVEAACLMLHLQVAMLMLALRDLLSDT
jgi:hypothetical protein